MVDFAPLAPQLARSFAPFGDAGSLVNFGGEQEFESPPELGDLGWVEMSLCSLSVLLAKKLIPYACGIL